MLAMADRKGRVWASVPGLANRARVSLEDTETALGTLLAPDRYSRTPDFDGRRIEPIDGGWKLLNHAKYRDTRDDEVRRDYMRDYMRGYRKHGSLTVNPSKPGLAKAEADTEAESNTKSKAMRSHGSRLPPDWEPSATLTAWFNEKRPDLDLTETIANFRDHWKAATKNATKLDWDAAFRVWARGQRVIGKPQPAPAGKRPGIICSDCHKPALTWTAGRCDPCWRKSQGLAA